MGVHRKAPRLLVRNRTSTPYVAAEKLHLILIAPPTILFASGSYQCDEAAHTTGRTSPAPEATRSTTRQAPNASTACIARSQAVSEGCWSPQPRRRKVPAARQQSPTGHGLPQGHSVSPQG